jgi:hypothetical protein
MVLCFYFVCSTGGAFVCKKSPYLGINGRLYAAMFMYPCLTHKVIKFVQCGFTCCTVVKELNSMLDITVQTNLT